VCLIIKFDDDDGATLDRGRPLGADPEGVTGGDWGRGAV